MTLIQADIPRDVVVVSGADAGQFLHSQLAADIAELAVGHGVHSLLLEPTGHVCALLRVVRHRDHLYSIDVEAGFGGAVVDRLGRFILRSKVSMEQSDWLVRAFRGAAPADRAGIDAPVDPGWGDVADFDVVGAPGALPELGERTETEHVDKLRVDARWPRLGVDIIVGDIPATTGVLRAAASFTKGCYPGQELVERMDARGATAPVMLRVLSRDGVNAGSRVTEDGHDVGTVTSVGFTRAIARVARTSLLGEPLG